MTVSHSTIRFISLFGAFFAAVAIFLLSLTSSALRVHSSDGFLQRSFYVDDQVLPDHITYPVLMALDRFRLETASPVERIYVQTEYANRRLAYSLELLERQQFDLAVTTVTKSQKYLLHAAHEYSSTAGIQKNESLDAHLANTIEYHLRHLQQIRTTYEFPNQQRAALDKLSEELQVIQLEFARNPSPLE